jgi:D-alanyl-D-alanine carboxypeptidase
LTAWLRNLTLFAALLLALTFTAARAAGPSMLFDPATGEVISHDRAGEPWYPASLTKLMTSYLVFKKLRAGQLTLDQKILVSEIAHAQPPSKIGVPTGKSVSVDFAVQSLLVYSANDMAYVLAEAAGGTSQNFVAAMNEQAAALGMTGTHYVNPNGLFEPRQITTARDVGLLTSAILSEFPEYAHYFAQSHVAVGSRKLANRNSLIRQMPEADGMKTGFVCNSGFNLVASATRDGRKLVAVVFGAQSGKARADLAQMLLIDGFSRQPQAPRPRVSDLTNDPLGTIVPADMTASVCRRKLLVTITNAHDLTGWGVSFGKYETAQQADMALRGRLLSPSGRDAAGSAGVIEIPGQAGFSAVVWDIDQSRSLSTCARYRTEKAYCDVMTPETFAAIAALTPAPKPEAEKPQAQGSDAGKTKKKKKSKKK